LQDRAREVAARHGAGFVAAATAAAWIADPSRTTYLLDVRTPEEFAARPVPGFAHAPGGQLIQATDQWLGVRGARLVVMDEECVRAPVVRVGRRALGHEPHVLEGGMEAAAGGAWKRPATPAPRSPSRPTIGATEAAAALKAGTAGIIDLRPSMSYRKGHI